VILGDYRSTTRGHPIPASLREYGWNRDDTK